MSKRLVAGLAICLMASTAVHAQGRGGGGGGGGRGGGRGGGQPSTPSTQAVPAPPGKAPIPVDQIQIVGVITAIDADAQRITIAYEPVEAMNWPAGSMPFGVLKSAVMKDAKVGEKVRFRLENQQIAALVPYTPPAEIGQ